MDLKTAIAKQREALAALPEWKVDVTCGGEIFTVTVPKIDPDAWDALVEANPPRHGNESDALVGYDQRAVLDAYPALVNGERPEEWGEFVSVLDSMHRKNISTLIWNANVYETISELKALGKDRAGKK